MYYVSSKNPLSAVPATSELVRYSLLSRVSGDNGITAVKNLEVATNRLDRTYFTVNAVDGIKMLQPTTVANSLLVTGNINGNGSLTIAANGSFGTINATGSITSNSVIYSNGPTYTQGRSSDDWYSNYTTVRTTSSSWTSAALTLQSYLPFAWQYSTTNGTVSTYGTNYKVGINTISTIQGLSIKGTSTLATALSVQGTIEATGDIIAYTTSDIKFKKNVEPLKNSLQKISQISGVTFDWDSDHRKGHDVGVIAQEIERVLPEAVIDRGSDGKAVNYEKIIPLLIEAIKELANR